MDLKIEELRSAIRPQFDEVINRLNEKGENSLYYKFYLNDWKKQWKEEVKGNQEYEDIDKELLLEFLNKQTLTVEKTTRLFVYVNRFTEPNPSLSVKINLLCEEVKQRIGDVGYFEYQLKERDRKKEYSSAFDLKKELLQMWEGSMNLMKTICRIDVYKTPLAADFKIAKKNLKKSIRRKDVDFLYRIKDNVQPISIPQNSTPLKNKDLNEYPWFKVGLKFATGEAYALRDNYREGSIKGGAFKRGYLKKITLDMDLKASDRPWVSDTFSGSKRVDNKNILGDAVKVNAIYSYCEKNNIPMCPTFELIHKQINSIHKQY